MLKPKLHTCIGHLFKFTKWSPCVCVVQAVLPDGAVQGDHLQPLAEVLNLAPLQHHPLVASGTLDLGIELLPAFQVFEKVLMKNKAL